MAELLEDWVCPAVQAPSQGNGLYKLLMYCRIYATNLKIQF